MNILKKSSNIFGKNLEKVEKIHKSISNIPFETLDSIEPIKSKVKLIKNVHDSIVDGAYDTIKKVNDNFENSNKKIQGWHKCYISNISIR